MNYKELFNSATKWGLILGLILSISKIIELRGVVNGGANGYFILFVEWLVVLGVTIYLLYRANRQRVQSLPIEAGYRLGNVMNYTILISIFAGVIVGISTHIYIVNIIGGYDVYTAKSLTSISALYSEYGVDETLATYLGQIEDSIETMKQNPPSIISSIFSSLSSYIFMGLILSLIITPFVKRKPILNSNNEQ